MSYVYSKCFAHEVYLQIECAGTRYACERFIRLRVRAGRPTHFLFISKLDIVRATRRYL